MRDNRGGHEHAPFFKRTNCRFLSCITIQSALEEGETIDNVPILSMARLMPGGVDNNRDVIS